MAVTVTASAPSAALSPIFSGSYGQTGDAASVAVSTVGSNKRIRVSDLGLSGTYATGGFTLNPSEYGLTEVFGLAVVCDADSVSAGDAVPRLTATGGTPTVKLFGADNVELADTTSVADFTYTVLLFGI